MPGRAGSGGGHELPRPAAGAASTPPPAQPAVRATQESDYGRRGKGYVVGAFLPATGAAFTPCYSRRTTANWGDFLERVEAWLAADAGPV